MAIYKCLSNHTIHRKSCLGDLKCFWKVTCNLLGSICQLLNFSSYLLHVKLFKISIDN